MRSLIALLLVCAMLSSCTSRTVVPPTMVPPTETATMVVATSTQPVLATPTPPSPTSTATPTAVLITGVVAETFSVGREFNPDYQLARCTPPQREGNEGKPVVEVFISGRGELPIKENFTTMDLSQPLHEWGEHFYFPDEKAAKGEVLCFAAAKDLDHAKAEMAREYQIYLETIYANGRSCNPGGLQFFVNGTLVGQIDPSFHPC